MSALARYRRQIVLREVGVNGQQLLRDSSVLIVGVGGLGSAAAPYLAGAGLGRLVLTDIDRVDLSNLQRQLLYRQADVGRDKLAAASDSLRALNPDCEIELLPGPLDDAGLLAAARGADLVLDCSDNFPTRFAVNRACVAARKPLVSGAAIRFEGQLGVFDLRRGGPCYACLYPDLDSAEAAETCEEAGILGPVVGTIGSLQALSAIKLLLGLASEAGTLRLWNALDGQWRSLKLRRDPQCPVCGLAQHP
ncbi:MAG: Adenylyltransferase and sulfurtransferase [Hydrocarboniphaga sp.]|uniref:HesA/MoeB/ThiF family protein n=1 Tax=Hydrocarboniphaga sp. TaxID=2033016 RepID=UPI00260B5AB3|nr:HesA/MoeB/ThiF family protein [Hydrocarboniphaga sp.]MDB5969808.1 Adenylyltransferase and sulfurtransferase [Hydrocarboniphaga sp.]